MRALFRAAAVCMTLPFAEYARACDTPVSVCSHNMAGAFAIVAGAKPAQLLVDPSADPALVSAADGFAQDLTRLTGATSPRIQSPAQITGNVVIAGVLGRSPVIDGLVRTGKIKTSDLVGQWEAYRQIVVDNPFPGVARALVIVGADRRGAVFGLYDLSEKMGVSPWTWWADVPVQRRSDIFITAGARRDQPKIRYRGFFINDEDPAFSS